MSDMAQAFLERWTQENISATTLEVSEDEAERLAEACKAEALDEGISEEDLAEACALSSDDEYTDITSYMLAALDRAAEARDEDMDTEDEDED